MFESMALSELLGTAVRAQRTERSGIAQQLIAIGTYAIQRMDEEADKHDFWCVDDLDVVAAEVAAELGISRARALTKMNYGKTLVDRLPQLAQVFVAGDLDFRVFAIIDYRTGLITDPDILGTIDTELADRAPGWNHLSDKKIAELLDWLVITHDPDAVRVARSADEDRHLEMDTPRNGVTEIWGSLRASDAAALTRRLDQLAATVCPNDPRTKRQRRADATGALSEYQTAMPCMCGLPDCPATKNAAPISPIVIHVLAEPATLDATSDTPGYACELGPIPADAVREMATHAKIRPLPHPAASPAEPHYRPSAALAEFIRCRDLTCRFPGCDCPAEYADIDHTVPYPAGPTHASNLKILCRFHHLMKTFYSTWNDQQLPDGTVIWTSPTGRTYTTTPHGALFFPQLATPTGELTLPKTLRSDTPGRGLAMPTRRRTRAQEKAYRIETERRSNRTRYAADPPPF